MSRILESVEKHYNNGLELDFDTLYQVLRTLYETECCGSRCFR